MWLNRILLSLVLATTLTAPTASADVPGGEASFEVFMVVPGPDGWRYVISARVHRGSVSGTYSNLCVGAHRDHVDTSVDPPRRTVISEGGCPEADLWVYFVDPVAWETAVTGSSQTTVHTSTYVWNDGWKEWELVGHEHRSSVATFDLRWQGTPGVVGPVAVGVPVCLTYNPLMPVYPCPSKAIGAGLSRPAVVEGSLRFGDVDVDVTDQAPPSLLGSTRRPAHLDIPSDQHGRMEWST